MVSALLESFGIHLRNLIDFFYTSRLKPDDVIAEDFCPGWSETISGTLKAAKEGANKEISHLTLCKLHTHSEGHLERVEKTDASSEDFSPCLLTPMVASRTSKMSYPRPLIRETTSEICLESDRDLLIASPSSFMSCLSFGSTWVPNSPRMVPGQEIRKCRFHSKSSAIREFA